MSDFTKQTTKEISIYKNWNILRMRIDAFWKEIVGILKRVCMFELDFYGYAEM